MKLSKVFSPKYIALGKDLKNKEEIFREIAKLAVKSSNAQDYSEDEIFHALNIREEMCSTSFGNGIAIPHCKLPKVKDFVTGVITIPNGVDFGATDKIDVKLVVFIIGPTDNANGHIRLLSLIAHRLYGTQVLGKILEETDPASIPKLFAQNANCDLSIAEHCSNKHLMHVIVQDEDLFNEILQIVSGVENSQVVLSDIKYEGSYLAQIPIFANIWSDKDHEFCKMIIAIHDKEHTGDIVKRIDEHVGGLDKCDRVLLMVQHLFYSAGSLQF